VEGSPELTSLLRVQVDTAQTIRTAAARVAAPRSLHRMIAQRRPSRVARLRRRRSAAR
jgi:hypothetical protein